MPEERHMLRVGINNVDEYMHTYQMQCHKNYSLENFHV